jgi:non-specific serine/threonine protein kinase/serine/threonine-protein kinase
MRRERWQQVRQVFEKASGLDSEERAAYLDQACTGDADLRQEVESLLSSASLAGSVFLGKPAAELAGIATDLVPATRTGTRIGVYQILEEIGHGGMGEVYSAVRADGQYEKEVAVKIVRGGFDSRAVLERFRNERQILASLDHPNIARLLDGGTTDDGTPYLVMELIRGKSIDQYCDQRQLSINDRLQLFVRVCRAVRYAHQRLVIHRDIKPSNILVTEEGVPKLLDFGIAKILDTAAQVEVTQLRPMTPEYASPEQVRGEPITTATDVYSLGVVLYQLLTGHFPYSGDTSTPHALARAICETEAIRPSTVVVKPEIRRDKPSESVSADELSRLRDMTPAKLRRRLRGDLDNIVLAALRKEPERRYTSVERFVDDLRRHREGLPVTATRGSWSYRAGKFVRRHKVSMAAAAVVALAILGGIAATVREARIARRQAEIARDQRRRAEKRFNEVRKLANSLLFEVHDSIKDLPGSTPARKLLVTRALEYLDSLSQEAKGDASLQRELAAAYQRIGDVQGQPRQANLGDRVGAETSYRKSLTIREGLVAADPMNEELRRELVMGYGKLSDLLREKGDLAGAMENSGKQMATVEALFNADPTNVPNRVLFATYRMDHGYKQATIGGDREHGLENLQQGSILLEQLAAERPEDQYVHRILGLSYSRTAEILQGTESSRPEALSLYRKALAVKQALFSAHPNNADYERLVAYDQFEIGSLLKEMGELHQATTWDREALAGFQKLATADPASPLYRQDIAQVSRDLGEILTRTGDSRHAVELLEVSLSSLQNSTDASNPQTIAGALILADQFWLGKAHVLASLSPKISPQRKVDHCREAVSWFRRCLPALEALRSKGGSDNTAAAQIQEIQHERMQCAVR